MQCDHFVDCSLDFTYLHESLNQRSHIDFFLVSNNSFNSIVDDHVIESAVNFSDHLPISLIFKSNTIDNTSHQPIRSKQSKSEQKYYRWVIVGNTMNCREILCIF